MENPHNLRERLERATSLSVQSWQRPKGPDADKIARDITVDMGWGRILFGQTFQSAESLYEEICNEENSKRDITFYLRDPHVLLSIGPDKLFLDPSHTYRLWMHEYQASSDPFPAFNIRRVSTLEDGEALNRIYSSRQMVTCDPNFILERHASRKRTYLIAERMDDHQIIGTVTGLDHAEAFNDPELGASLWCLAVDPQANAPGVGEALVRHLVEHYLTKGRNYIDLSVMHDNKEAISLYEKLNFQRVPVFCVKCKNSINESLFIPENPEERLNPYAGIIIKEARKRGICVEVVDEEMNYFKLEHGGRSVLCRESLTELTSAIAMCRCDDKRLTHRVLKAAGLKVPAQYEAGAELTNTEILDRLERVVVKPARGEQGNGISVDIQTPEDLKKAISLARQHCPDVIVEEYVEGEDLRIIVIDYKMVAAAVRRRPQITGNGHHTVKKLIKKYNRRRASATGGESHVPMDDETRRCLQAAGHEYDTVPASGESIVLRKAANLHTGGTIHDVTDQLHPELSIAAVRTARALAIPVTGLDFMVPDVSGADYMIIEANERPGLANHEPQPTAERFIDCLFPHTVSKS
jgi:GNAT-family acetyltransferase (TIGR03103 family)